MIVIIYPKRFKVNGIIKTIRELLTKDHELFVCEMGANKNHDIKKLTSVFKDKLLELYDYFQTITLSLYKVKPPFLEEKTELTSFKDCLDLITSAKEKLSNSLDIIFEKARQFLSDRQFSFRSLL